jgi:hypothetical protein
MRLRLLLLVVVSAFAQISDVPYAPKAMVPGPTFTIKRARNCYPDPVSSIRTVNFRNFKFLNFSEDGKPSGDYALRNGHFQHDAKLDRYSIDFDSIHYLPGADSSTGGSALVILSWFAAGGSSSQGGNAKVFNLSANRLCVVQEIDWDTHFQAGQPTNSFDPRTNTLVIRSAHYIPGDAHCCVSAMDVVTLRWDGDEYAPAPIQAELSEYGKTQGKTLPRLAPHSFPHCAGRAYSFLLPGSPFQLPNVQLLHPHHGLHRFRVLNQLG